MNRARAWTAADSPDAAGSPVARRLDDRLARTAPPARRAKTSIAARSLARGQADSALAATRASAPALVRGSLAVLVVDASRADRASLVMAASRAGLDAEFEEAGSAASAIARLAQGRFDCLVVDSHLDACDELVRVAQAATPPCPVILVTQRADPRLAVAAMRAGAYDFFGKDALDGEDFCRSLEASRAWTMEQTERLRSLERLQHLGFYDSLTGLPNCNLFFDRVEKAIERAHRESGHFALLMLDLDQFKSVNDTLGHEAGDELLTGVARRLESIARRSDTFARIGGDEFAALLVGCGTIEAARAIGQKIEAAVRAPFPIAGTLVSVGVSIGAAIYPHHGTSARALFTSADHAMYASKRGAATEVCASGPESREACRAAVRARKLATAVRERAFVLAFEPRVDPRTRLAHGLDVGIRIEDTSLGRMATHELLALAEQHALLDELSHGVLERGLDQIVAWRRAGRPARRHVLAIPVPGRLLGQPELADRILAAIAERRLEPSCLMIDVAEGALVAHAEVAIRTVSALAHAGVGVTIDEFGCGFTSFRHLRDLEFAAVKIHSTFTAPEARTARNASIVRSIGELARGANARLVACGIDDDASMGWAASLGCDLVCGRAATLAMRPSTPRAPTDAEQSAIRPFSEVVPSRLVRDRD